MNSRSHANEVATIFGGAGFIGRHTVWALARRGWRIRAASRRPDLAGKFSEYLTSVIGVPTEVGRAK